MTNSLRWHRTILVTATTCAAALGVLGMPPSTGAQQSDNVNLRAARRAATQGLVQRTWMVEGTERQALLHLPEVATTTPTPVVFAFHGHGGSMQGAARMFRIHQLWPEAIVVYMQGLNTPGRLTDPEGKRPGWQNTPGAQGDRDLKFFDAVLATLKEEYQVDRKRVYSTGHSNGGGFTYLLWRTRGDLLAAVAPSASAARATLRDDEMSLKPKPVMHLAGEQDQLVKFAWQQRTMEELKRTNGCEAVGTEWAQWCTLYPSKDGTPVVTLIHPGTHQFPQQAAPLIVRFFKEHAQP